MPYGVDFCKFGPKALAYGPPIIPHAAPFVNSKNIQKIIKNFYKICVICLLTKKVNSNIAQKIGANLSKKQKSKLKSLLFYYFFGFLCSIMSILKFFSPILTKISLFSFKTSTLSIKSTLFPVKFDKIS